MSLINQMLQELDARGSDGVRGDNLYANVRPVPEARSNYLAWAAAVVVAMVAGGGASWLWLRSTSVPVKPDAVELPLKISPVLPPSELSRVQAFSARAPSADAPLAALIPSAPAVAPATQNGAKSVAVVAETPAEPQNLAPGSAFAKAPQSRTESTPQSGSNGEVANIDRPAVKAAKPAAIKASNASTSAQVVKEIRELTPQQLAENEYRRASTLVSQGRLNDAAAALEHALQYDPQHAAARQTLVGLLLEGKRQDDAIRRLQDGLALDPHQVGMAMILARLQVDKNDTKAAVETLQRGLPYAGERGDYHAFLAALEQRQGQHKEAIERYLAALKTAPQNAVWWMGIGISLQAENRTAEAHDAFSRAKAANTLSPELQAFVDQKLAQLPR